MNYSNQRVGTVFFVDDFGGFLNPKPMNGDREYAFGRTMSTVAVHGGRTITAVWPGLHETAYGVAIALIAAISLIRLYLGAHYPIDLLGGWMAGGALLAVIVAVYSLAVDGRVPA